jgi:hypothetical protein
MTDKHTVKENVKDGKVAADIRASTYGVNADDTRIEAMNKKDHVPYDSKGDTRNAHNTVSGR